MAVYIALKPCKFGDAAYSKNDKIPAEKVLATKVDALIKMGIISPSIEGISALVPEAEAIDTSVPEISARKTRTAKNKA